MKLLFQAACVLQAYAALAVAAFPAQGAAQAPDAARVPLGDASSPAAPKLFLVVNADVSEFSTAALAPRLSAELQTAVVPLEANAPRTSVGVITITWRPSRAELAVTFHDESRGVVSRVVEAPPSVVEALQAAVWLAGNVVRDDVSDFLGAAPVQPAAPLPSAPVVAPAVAPQLAPRAAQPALKPKGGYSPFTFSLVHPLATNANDPHIRTRLNLNLLMGRVGQVEGLQLGGLGLVSGSVSGGQVSLAANFAGGSVRGFQLATLLNVTSENFTGVQASFGVGIVGGDFEGVQGALLAHWVAGSMQGGQAALVLNGVQGSMHGLQLAFGVNHVGGNVVGAQLAAVNSAADLQGLQVGLLNIAKQVKGLQLGLVNIADDIKGVPIGLVSVTKSGGVHPMFWFSLQSPLNLAIKFATRYTYSAVVVSVGRDLGKNQIGPGYLLGAHIPAGRLYFETDIGANYLFGGDVCCVSSDVGFADDRVLARWRALLGLQLLDRLALFVGAGSTVSVRFKQGLDRETTATLLPDVFVGVAL